MKKSIAGIIISIVSLLASQALIAAPSPTESIDSRIGFVSTLINDSSASRKVVSSGNAQALELRAQASEKYEDAVASRDAGELDVASGHLSDAIHLMYAAVDAAKGIGSSAMAKGSRDYENRLASVEALLDAHARIAEEKGIKTTHAKLALEVRRDIAAADELLANGDIEAARTRLDSSYESVRSAVEGLREGETLVRELSFATKLDEYEYELDRNDTHQMLISLLVKDESTDTRRREQSQSLISSAAELREEAKSLANDGQIEEAISMLEKSTDELIKAIRGAGLYIPG